jgi:hypothetical protein
MAASLGEDSKILDVGLVAVICRQDDLAKIKQSRAFLPPVFAYHLQVEERKN